MKEPRRILIIENDLDSLSVIYTALLPFDYSVEAAMEIGDLRPRLERFQPDLLFLGQGLTEAGGQELCNWIKKHSEARLILLGRLKDLASARINTSCFEDELTKPIDGARLLNMLNSHLPV